MNVKMIITDLDRTLLRTDKTISNYSAGVLNRCRQRGIKVAFATARPLYGLTAFLAQIPVDAVIIQNGSGIYADGVMIANYTIPQNIALALYNRLRESVKGFAYSAQTLEQRYMNITRASFTTALDVAITQESIVFDDDALPEVAFNNISLRRIEPQVFKQIAEDFPTLRYYVTTGEDLIDICLHR